MEAFPKENRISALSLSLARALSFFAFSQFATALFTSPQENGDHVLILVYFPFDFLFLFPSPVHFLGEWWAGASLYTYPMCVCVYIHIYIERERERDSWGIYRRKERSVKEKEI